MSGISRPRRGFGVSLLGACMILAATTASASAAATLTVNDDTAGAGPAGATCATPGFPTISAAVAAASPGDTVAVCAGTYTESVTVDKELTLLGAQAGVDARGRVAEEAIVQAVGADGMTITAPVVVNGFKLTNASDDALDYGGNTSASSQTARDNIFDGNGSAVAGTFGNRSRFVENHVTSGTFRGVDISGPPQVSMDIRENQFDGIPGADLVLAAPGPYADLDVKQNGHSGGSGRFAEIFGTADIEIVRNSIIGFGSSAIHLGGANHSALISDNAISDNGTAGGVTVAREPGSQRNSDIDVVSNAITGTLTAVHVASNSVTDSTDVHRNRIVDNGAGAVNEAGSGGTINGENNWWGCNAGPGSAACDSVSGDVVTSPHLVLTLVAAPGSIETGGDTSAIRASLRSNSGGAESGPDFPDGTPVSLSTSLGALSAPTVLNRGIADGTLTSGSQAGTATVTATVDNQAVTTPVTITQPAIPGPPVPPGCGANKIKGKNVADKLVGTSGPDLIKGKRGDDRIKGRGGADCMVGGKGRDRINALDGVADRINCGAGKKDRVRADSIDVLHKKNCERVKIGS